jgi:hypothetical protein
MMRACRSFRHGAGITDRRNAVMGTSTTVATGRFSALARLAVALGFAATLLVGQAVFFDSPASARDCNAECKLFELADVRFP